MKLIDAIIKAANGKEDIIFKVNRNYKGELTVYTRKCIFTVDNNDERKYTVIMDDDTSMITDYIRDTEVE